MSDSLYYVIMKTLFFKQNIYSLKWQLVFNPDYKISECRKIINTKTGRVIKETVVGYTCVFWIGKKFISKKRLNDYCEKIDVLTLKKLKDLYPNLYS